MSTIVQTMPDAPADTVSKRIQPLDGYRAVAAIAVLVSHTAGEVGFSTPTQPGSHLVDNLGNYGVAVFFILSGFVNYRPFASATLNRSALPDATTFIARRGLRIFPAYWVALLAWAVFASPTQREPGSPFAMLLLADSYNTDNTWLTGLYVSWSLTVEIAFYLLLPVISHSVNIAARRIDDPTRRLQVHFLALAGMTLVAYAYRTIPDRFPSAPSAVRIWFPGFFDWFALGMLLAVLDVWRTLTAHLPAWLTDLSARTWACWTCAAAGYVAVVVLKGDQLLFSRAETPAQASWRFFFQGVSAFFLVLPVVLGNRTQGAMRVLGSRRVLFLGSISFGVYLWHPVVMLWFHDSFHSFAPAIRFLVLTTFVIALTAPIAYASYRLVEMPSMRLRLLGQTRSDTPTTRQYAP